jgi:transcriptional regulator with XRE-family HTH domain
MTANTGERDDREQAREYPEGQGDIPADTFAARLMLARHHAGRLSIEKAAERCGLNGGNWAHWENGRRPLDKVEIAQAVSKGLDINFNWLLLGGPLLPARGRPTRSARVVTHQYPRLTVCPNGIQANGRPAPDYTTQPARRPRLIDRSQPVGAAI